eukprot:g21518.t1
MLIASKVWEDIHPWNADFEEALQEILGIRYRHGALYKLESLFLEKLRWEVFVDGEIYAAYFFALQEGRQRESPRRSRNSRKILQRYHSTDMSIMPIMPIIEERSGLDWKQHGPLVESETDIEKALASPDRNGPFSGSSCNSARSKAQNEDFTTQTGESLKDIHSCWRLDAGAENPKAPNGDAELTLNMLEELGEESLKTLVPASRRLFGERCRAAAMPLTAIGYAVPPQGLAMLADPAEDVPFGSRKDAMSLDVVRPKDVPRGRVRYEKDYQQSLACDDIAGARPEYMLRSLHLDGAPPKEPYVKDMSLSTHDVDGAQSKVQIFTTTRNTNPLTPRYNLQSTERTEAPANPMRLHDGTLRESMDFKARTRV